MIIKEEKKDEFDHFLEELESYGLELGSKLEEIEQEKRSYEFFQTIKRKLEESKQEFCSSYFNKEEAEKEEFRQRLLSLFKDLEIVDNIIQEIINLYYLQEAGLLDQEEIAPQKELAEENLKTLGIKIDKYIQDTNIDQLQKDEEHLSTKLERLVDLGSALESEEDFPIDDIDFLEEMLERVELSDEVKRSILTEIIRYNVTIYQGHLQKKINHEPIEVLEIEELKDDFTLSSECLHALNDLLADRAVIERIVEIINDEFTMVIDIKSPTDEEEEQIQESIQMAREEIISDMTANQEKTPEEALNDFFQEFDETEKKKRKYLEKLLEDTEESNLTPEEQEELMRIAYAFIAERKNLIKEMSSEEKRKVRSYMQSLYQDSNSRDLIYQSGIYVSKDNLSQEAAYEIAVYKDLLDAVPEEDQETAAKVCRKLEEILTSYEKAIEKDTVEKKEVEEGNLFFLMADETTTTLEEDIHTGRLSQNYFNEIKNQLSAIEERSTRNIYATQPVNPGFKALKKEGVKYTTGTRTKVFFIPIGKKDSIIVGVSFITGKDTNKEQDNRIKKFATQIQELRGRLMDPETYVEDKMKATGQRNRIMSLLTTNKELEEMVMVEENEGETSKQK